MSPAQFAAYKKYVDSHFPQKPNAPSKPSKPSAPSKPTAPAKPNPPMSPAQYAAYLHYLKTHPLPGPALTKIAGAVMPEEFGGDLTYWILGGNDLHDTCVMTALANSLLCQEGSRTSDDEVKAAGENLSIKAGLEYIEDYGLNGWELESCIPVKPDFIALITPGVIIGLSTPYGRHVATVLGDGSMISWGHSMPMRAPFAVDEAWLVTWKGGESWRAVAR